MWPTFRHDVAMTMSTRTAMSSRYMGSMTIIIAIVDLAVVASAASRRNDLSDDEHRCVDHDRAARCRQSPVGSQRRAVSQSVSQPPADTTGESTREETRRRQGLLWNGCRCWNGFVFVRWCRCFCWCYNCCHYRGIVPFWCRRSP